MKTRLLLIALLASCSVFCQEDVELDINEWNNDFYEKYTIGEFIKLDIIHQRIDTENIDYKLFNAAIFYYTNIQRVKNNRLPFQHSIALEKAAFEHSKDMVLRNFFSHTSPIKGKKSMSDRLSIVGVNNGYRAENIAINFDKSPTYSSLALKLVEQWMTSKGHRENILNEKYNYLGCGVYYYVDEDWGESYHFKSTQNFFSGND